MDDLRDLAMSSSAPPMDGYEAPMVFDMGDVFEVTAGSASGSADVNGQGFH